LSVYKFKENYSSPEKKARVFVVNQDKISFTLIWKMIQNRIPITFWGETFIKLLALYSSSVSLGHRR